VNFIHVDRLAGGQKGDGQRTEKEVQQRCPSYSKYLTNEDAK